MSPGKSGSPGVFVSRGEDFGVRTTRRSLADAVKAMGKKGGVKSKRVPIVTEPIFEGCDVGEGLFVESPPKPLPVSEYIALAEKGLLPSYLEHVEKQHALWRSYYASKQACSRVMSANASVSSFRSGTSAKSWRQDFSDKFAALGERRRSSGSLISRSSDPVPQLDLGKGVVVTLGGEGMSAGDYASEAAVETYGDGGCYLRVIRKGMLPHVFSRLGPWPSIEELLDLPGECFIQAGGFVYRGCSVIQGRVHVFEAFSGPNFVTLLSEHQGSKPAWAKSAIADYPLEVAKGRLALRPGMLIGGVGCDSLFKRQEVVREAEVTCIQEYASRQKSRTQTLSDRLVQFGVSDGMRPLWSVGSVRLSVVSGMLVLHRAMVDPSLVGRLSYLHLIKAKHRAAVQEMLGTGATLGAILALDSECVRATWELAEFALDPVSGCVGRAAGLESVVPLLQNLAVASSGDFVCLQDDDSGKFYSVTRDTCVGLPLKG